MPFLSVPQWKLSLRATPFTAQFTAHSASTNYSAGQLRTTAGIPGAVDINIRELPDVVNDHISSPRATGYTLFSQSASFRLSEMLSAVEGVEQISVAVEFQA